MAEQEERITLRIPKDLHALIKNLADSEKRSLNSQIVYLLEQAVMKGKPKRP